MASGDDVEGVAAASGSTSDNLLLAVPKALFRTCPSRDRRPLASVSASAPVRLIQAASVVVVVALPSCPCAMGSLAAAELLSLLLLGAPESRSMSSCCNCKSLLLPPMAAPIAAVALVVEIPRCEASERSAHASCTPPGRVETSTSACPCVDSMDVAIIRLASRSDSTQRASSSSLQEVNKASWIACSSSGVNDRAGGGGGGREAATGGGGGGGGSGGGGGGGTPDMVIDTVQYVWTWYVFSVSVVGCRV